MVVALRPEDKTQKQAGLVAAVGRCQIKLPLVNKTVSWEQAGILPQPSHRKGMRVEEGFMDLLLTDMPPEVVVEQERLVQMALLVLLSLLETAVLD